MTALRIADPLADYARREARLMHRSLAAQVEHWAWLGAQLEKSGVSLETIRNVKLGLGLGLEGNASPAANGLGIEADAGGTRGGTELSVQERAAELFAGIGNPAADATARAQLLAHGLPLYGVTADGGLVEEQADGRQRRGGWDAAAGRFVARG